MKHKNSYGLIALMALVLMMGACNEDDYNELPDSVARFVSEYYPFTEVSGYTMSEGNYVVDMKMGQLLF